MQDFHTHTVFSDGKNTPEEMVLAAIQKGMSAIGFSEHSYLEEDRGNCLEPEQAAIYRQTVAALKEKYAGKIKIFCGIEQDYHTPDPAEGYEYIIGSAHFVEAHGRLIPVDYDLETFQKLIQEDFGGDVYALAEAYYRNMADVLRKTNADIIGHFDLITKYNEVCPLIDTAHPRYIAAWQAAVDALLPYGKPFEINTGAISRGYRTTPYPAKEIRDYIRERGGTFLLSSDSHRAETLCYGFSEILMAETASYAKSPIFF